MFFINSGEKNSLFEPCWQLIQNRATQLATNLSKLALQYSDEKNSPYTICNVVIETTAVSITEIRKLFTLCQKGQISEKLQVPEKFSEVSESQNLELAELANSIVRKIIFDKDDDINRFENFKNCLDPATGCELSNSRLIEKPI